ncbi:389ff54a-da62-4529-920b-35c106c1babd [Sclerotinia trifoliorum]|uniref:389ff54a-da62-4529-920b-35c106c1babd n=1 Tax=Sclerotinia trifoliorum TaxID=28548 RepID=A0A8H2ZP42_9HELO|nr:389ff54a-da62-4529-920b-35c106c1babd [Sclerotinia trifoliorum]
MDELHKLGPTKPDTFARKPIRDAFDKNSILHCKRRHSGWLYDNLRKVSECSKELERLIADKMIGHLLPFIHISSQSEPGGALIPRLCISSGEILGTESYLEKELMAAFNTHDSLEAYYELARFRFTHNITPLQVIERHLLGSGGIPLLFYNSFRALV